MVNFFCSSPKRIYIHSLLLAGVGFLTGVPEDANANANVLKALMVEDKVSGEIVSSNLNSFKAIKFDDKKILAAKFYYSPSTGNKSPNTVLSLSDQQIKEYSKGAVALRCLNGEFEAHSVKYVQLGMKCKEGLAYRIEIIANTDTQKYSVKIVSSAKETIQLDKLSFRAKVSKLNTLNFITDSLTTKSKSDLIAAGVFNELKVLNQACKLQDGKELAHLKTIEQLRYKNVKESSIQECEKNLQTQVMTCNNGALSAFTPNDFKEKNCSVLEVAVVVPEIKPVAVAGPQNSPMASTILSNPMPESSKKLLLEYLSRTQVGPFKKCSDLPSVAAMNFDNQDGRVIQNVNVLGGIKIGTSKNVIIRNVCAKSISTVSGEGIGGGGTLIEHVYLDGKFESSIGINMKGTVVVRNSIVENHFDHLRALNFKNFDHLKVAGLDTNLPYGAVFMDSLYGYWGARKENGVRIMDGNHADFYQWPVWSTNDQRILFKNNFIFGKNLKGDNFDGMTVNSIKSGMDFIGNIVVGAQDALRISAVEAGGRIIGNIFEKKARCYSKEEAKKVEWSGNKDLNGKAMEICK